MREKVEGILLNSGIEHFGFSRLETPTTMEFYKSWIADGMAGSMEYLEKHVPFKVTPQKLLPKARTSIMIARSYVPHPSPTQEQNPSLPIARYAQGDDYHDWFLAEVKKVVDSLKKDFPTEEFLPFTDSQPVLERELAYKAGLGWVGKNTCLIDEKRGSFFLLGGILSTLDLDARLNVAADRCGTCTRCIDACPTGAIVEPRKLDARLCISYLTIEDRGIAPLPLRNKIDWFFGCDICQTVCPWNGKVLNNESVKPESDRTEAIASLRSFLAASNRELEELFKGTPLLRARPFGLRRNAVYMAVKYGFSELENEIRNLSAKDDRYNELVEWALAAFTGQKA